MLASQSVVRLFVVLVAFIVLQQSALSEEGPRPGKYRILSFGATTQPPLFLGSFVLEKNGTYKAFLPGDKLQGEGTWSFDAAKQEVLWKTGPYKEMWGGAFTSEREGKTHKIRLKRTTIGTNSTDA